MLSILLVGGPHVSVVVEGELLDGGQEDSVVVLRLCSGRSRGRGI